MASAKAVSSSREVSGWVELSADRSHEAPIAIDAVSARESDSVWFWHGEQLRV